MKAMSVWLIQPYVTYLFHWMQYFGIIWCPQIMNGDLRLGIDSNVNLGDVIRLSLSVTVRKYQPRPMAEQTVTDLQEDQSQRGDVLA